MSSEEVAQAEPIEGADQEPADAPFQDQFETVPAPETEPEEPETEPEPKPEIQPQKILHSQFFLNAEFVDMDPDGSMRYEKDGDWKLEKEPGVKRKSNLKNQISPSLRSFQSDSDAALPRRRKCCLDKDAKPLSFTQNFLAMYDVVTGCDSYPCNECDRPLCQESVWQWLSAVVTDVVATVKELRKKPDMATKSCGTIDGETLLKNTKGTHASIEKPDAVSFKNSDSISTLSGGSSGYEANDELSNQDLNEDLRHHHRHKDHKDRDGRNSIHKHSRDESSSSN